MLRMGLRWRVAAALFCMSATAFLGAPTSLQVSAAQSQPSPQLSHRAPATAGPSAGKVKLDVLVTDDAGRPVPGLEQADFTVLDNHQPRPILSFQAYPPSATASGGTAKLDPPLEIILLVDTANSAFQRVAFERTQVDAFLRQNGGHLTRPTSLMLFSDQNVKVQPHPSTDGNAIAKALDESETAMHTIPLSRGYDAVDRMSLSLKTLHSIAAVEGTKPGRKMLLWIGPGWPMLEGAGYNLSAASRERLFNNIVDLSRTLREARVTLYSLHDYEAGAPGPVVCQALSRFSEAGPIWKAGGPRRSRAASARDSDRRPRLRYRR